MSGVRGSWTTPSSCSSTPPNEDITFTLPGEGYAPTWKVALDTAPAVDGDSDPVLAADDTVVVEARSMLFLIDAPESAATTERHQR